MHIYKGIAMEENVPIIEINTGDDISIGFHSSVVATKLQQRREAGMRYSDSEGLASSYDWFADDQLTFGVHGTIPSGQVVELPCANVFIEYQNSPQGNIWQPPYKVVDTEGIDCVAKHIDGKQMLNMQITMALSAKSFWKRQSISTSRGLHQMPVMDLAKDLWTSAEKKRPFARQDTVLLLSALLTLGHATPQVAVEFRERFGSMVNELGFSEVWVVGADAAHVFKLS